jgi:hypothetical protein
MRMKKLDLPSLLGYDANYVEGTSPHQNFHKGVTFMKLVVRILALSLVVVGGVAAALTPKTAQFHASHLAATQRMPIPECMPGVPTCAVSQPSLR